MENDRVIDEAEMADLAKVIGNPEDYDIEDVEPAGTGIVLTPGERVRTLREVAELTQAELAAETGIPQNAISAIERGAVNLGLDRAKVFARAFGVHPAIILFSDWQSDDGSNAA